MSHMHAGSGFSLFLDEEGNVWACGSNAKGQLGFENPKNRMTPEKIPNLPPIQAVSGGGSYSLFLDHSGQVWGCGENYNGSLGLKGETVRLPQKISIKTKVKAISADSHASVLLDEKGAVWCFGSNKFGQIGQGKGSSVKKPKKISKIPTMQAISCGGLATLFMDTEGSMWFTGYSENMLRSHGCTKNVVDKPIKLSSTPAIKQFECAGLHSLLLDADNNVHAFGNGYYGQSDPKLCYTNIKRIVTPAPIKNFSTNGNDLLFYNSARSGFVDVEGQVWMTGFNDHGALGVGDTEKKPTLCKVDIPPMEDIEMGSSHTLFLQEDGSVWSCGSNSGGQVGLGLPVDDRLVPEKIQIPVPIGGREGNTKSARAV